MNQLQWRDYFCIPTFRFSCFNIILYSYMYLWACSLPNYFKRYQTNAHGKTPVFKRSSEQIFCLFFFSTIYKRLDSQLISWFTSVDLSDYILSSSHLVFQRFFSLTVISCVEKRMDGNMNKSLNFKNEFPAKPVIIEKRRVMRSTFNY